MWLFKLCNEDGVWQELFRNKTLKDKNALTQVNKRAGLTFGRALYMGVKDQTPTPRKVQAI